MQNSNKRELFSIGKASEYLGVSIDTLRRWEQRGKVVTYRSPGGHRYFEKRQLDTLFGKKYHRTEPTERIKKKKIEVPAPNIYASPVYPFTPPLEKPSADRPPREIKIPPVTAVRIIREIQQPQSALQSPNLSILTPAPTPVEMQNLAQETPKKKVFTLTRNQKLTALGVIILVVSASILIIVLGPSQQILSPVP